LAVVLLGVAVVLSWWCPLAVRAAQQQRLKEIESRLQQTRRQVAEVARREGSLLDELNAAARLEAGLKKEGKRLAAKITTLEQEIAATRKKLERIEHRLAGLHRRFAARLRARYRMRPLHVVAVLSSPRTMTEKMRQLTYLRAVLQADRADIAAYDELYRRQKMAADELDLRQAELDRTREQQLRQLAALKESVAKKQSLLYNIREKKEYYQSLAAELEAAATELKRIALARRKASRAPQGSLEEHRGRLPMPAKGVVVRFFGRHRDRRFNTVTESRGIDIQAPPGTEVHSVFAGTVIFADWLRGYGNLVIVDHGEGYYTVYAHLQEMLVAVDRKLGQHEVLGLVGDTDSLAGPRLHFEIRRHGSPLDPLEWVSPMG
jgi:septal ring factor EnvC (AmiA/AmiB activator)